MSATRLSRSTTATAYNFTLDLDIDRRRFSGFGRILLAFAQATGSFALNAKRLDINRAILKRGDKELPLSLVVDSSQEIVNFNIATLASAGTAELLIEWSGFFAEGLRGLYFSQGVVVTQFEEAEARTVFPCLDEPFFRGTWELSVEAPDNHVVISNGALRAERRASPGRRLRQFARTLPIPSYLVAIVSGPLEEGQRPTPSKYPIHIWANLGKTSLTSFAAECCSALLVRLESYFGSKYAFAKLDLIAVPDFEAGAMENAACITFREDLLLVDGASASVRQRAATALTIAHEIAHHWFGNLVSIAWWDDLWLKEAIATWVATKIVDEWHPEWQVWDEYMTRRCEALEADALEATRPVHCVVDTVEEASANFDVIAYYKGMSIVRMLESHVGESQFREGLRRFLKKFRLSSATSTDLWKCLEQSAGAEVSKIGSAWSDTCGHPFLTVEVLPEASRATVRLNQRRERHGLTEHHEPSTWPTPFGLHWIGGGGAVNTSNLFVDRDATFEFEVPRGTPYLNAGGVGFYRLANDLATERLLIANARKLVPLEQLSFLADQQALFLRGDRPGASLFLLATDMLASENPSLLASAIRSLELLSSISDLSRMEAIGEHAAGILKQHRLLHDRRESAVGSMAGIVLRAHVALGVRVESDAELRQLTTRFLSGDELALAASVAEGALAYAMSFADPCPFAQVEEVARHGMDPNLRRYASAAMPLAKDPSVIQQALSLTMDEEFERHLAIVTLTSALKARSSRDHAWNFVIENGDKVLTRLAAPLHMRRLIDSLMGLSHRAKEVIGYVRNSRHFGIVGTRAIDCLEEQLGLLERARSRVTTEPSWSR